MKKLTTILLLTISVGTAFAQQPTNKIVLAKNQQLKFTTTVKGNTTSEKNGELTETIQDVTTNTIITVKNIVDNSYKVDAVETDVSIKTGTAGEEKKFDSNNKDDMAGGMKDEGKDINVIKQFTLSNDGKNIAEEDSLGKRVNVIRSNMIAKRFGARVNADIIAGYFMLIPYGKRMGDSWADSVAFAGLKRLFNFVWDSTEDNIALIKTTAKFTSNKTENNQGVDITINNNIDITQTLKVDLKTGVVLSKVTISKTKGTIEFSGQINPLPNINISGTSVTTVTAD